MVITNLGDKLEPMFLGNWTFPHDAFLSGMTLGDSEEPIRFKFIEPICFNFFDYSPLEPLWIRFQAPKKEYITREWFCDIPTECYIVDSCSDIAMGDDVPVLKMILF